MKVDIFITTKWKGNFAKGKGSYGIILQVEQNGNPITKEHYAGWDNLSIQKLQVRSVTEAIQYITRPCDVVIHTDSFYIVFVIDEKNTNGKYQELWETFFDASNDMKSIKVELDGHHEYASYIKRKLSEGNYSTITDR